MISGESAKAGIYTDFQGLTELRGQARQQSPEALKAAAKQFEALFIQTMLKSMRQGSEAMGDGLMDNDQSLMYRDMYDKQLALNLSEGQGLGLAEMLVRQLENVLPAGAPAGADGRSHFAVPPRQSFAAPAPADPQAASTSQAGAHSEVSAADNKADPVVFETPEDFVRSLWPHARRAAEEIGADPKALLAQAALETGWGRAVIRRPDGESSHNLFNIKADHRWGGDRVAKQTLEYRDGVAVKERAPFRAYESYAASFEDYVDFLRSSPRYGGALEQASDPEAFIGELHRAGYATDPAYTDKVKRVMDSDTLNDTLATLKVSPERPIG